MNVVSFYAPRPEHPLFQDYIPYLKVLDESCRKYGHKHYVLTDADSLDGLPTFHVKLPQNLMKAVTAAQLAYLESPLAKEDTLLTGADCVLANDPAEVFKERFDIAFTTGPFQDCILNTGAVFVRAGVDAAKFWRGAVRILNQISPQWGDDQKALAACVNPTTKHGLYQRSGLDVRFLPVDPYNLAPENPGDDCSRGVVLHFRGPRKRWMRDYCAHRLGIGEPIKCEVLVNTQDEQIFANVRVNSARDLPWLHEQRPHDGHAVICGGGPSLIDTLPEIKWRAAQGQTIFALNGAAKFLREHGLTPQEHIIIDARPENLRFLDEIPASRFTLASQCHPSLFDALEGHDVLLFHCATEGIWEHVPREDGKFSRDTTLIHNGVTSGLTAMTVAFILGYRQIHLYGYDSSDRGDDGHAYPQDETDPEKKRLEVWLGAQRFIANAAMYDQAAKFPAHAQMLADAGAVITVHGDGLLPAVARSMATATPVDSDQEN